MTLRDPRYWLALALVAAADALLYPATVQHWVSMGLTYAAGLLVGFAAARRTGSSE